MAEDDQPLRRASDQSLTGKAMSIADMINRLGMAVFIAGAVVVVGIGWLVGWLDTPWVTPKDFQEFNRIYMKVHDSQNVIHTEQLMESKHQTHILKLLRCDQIESIAERRQCFHEVNP